MTTAPSGMLHTIVWQASRSCFTPPPLIGASPRSDRSEVLRKTTSSEPDNPAGVNLTYPQAE